MKEHFTMTIRKKLFIGMLGLAAAFLLPQFISAGQQEKKSSPGIDENVQVDEFPSPTKTVPPKYPETARKKGIAGTVFVKVLVGTDGVPKDARVVRNVEASLDSAARATLLQWRFKPATLKGSAVEVWVVVPVKFALSNDKGKAGSK